MRQTFVTVLLLAMLVGVAVLLASREFPTEPATVDSPQPNPSANTTPTNPATSSGASSGAAPSTSGNDSAKDAENTTEAKDSEKTLDRPLRVASLGWDFMAPAVLANNGLAGLAEEGDVAKTLYPEDLQVTFTTFSQTRGLEEALARGGAAKDGADIAIVALPTFVASYEKLRALSPKIFFVAGWSRGREGMAAVSMDALLKASKGRKSVTLRGERTAPATFLSLFMLGEAGVETRSVALADPSDIMGPRATFAAIDRAKKGHEKPGNARKILLTTADAQNLIPFVAIAPEGFLRKHPEAVRAWLDGWSLGTSKLRGDVPQAARQIAKLKSAPAELDLLNLLGLIEYASVYENIRLMGLSGRDPVSLERLFLRTWDVWRSSDVLTTPPPDAVPVASQFVAQLARTSKEGAPPAPSPSKPRKGASQETLLTVLLSNRKLDEARLQDEIAFLAGVFRKSTLRVTIARDRKQKKTQEVLGVVAERFRIPAKRLEAGSKMSGKGSAQIEVLFR